VGDGTASDLRIHLLGGFRVLAGGASVIDQSWRRRKAASIVKLLALQRDRALPREQVLDALWPDLDPAAAANNLHKNVHYIRTALEGHGVTAPLVSLSGGLVVLDGQAWCDVDAFRAAAAEARKARTNAALYDRALDLHTGDLLPADVYEPWCATQREELSGIFRQLALEGAPLHELRGDWQAALDRLGLIAADHADEQIQRAIMRAYALTGQADAALRVYDRCREALRRELGAEPSAETQRLHDDIGRGRVQAPPHAHAPESALVGRAREMERLAAALDEALAGAGGMVFIAGEPGIGKTRLSEELAAHAHVRGARVLWGRCDQSDAAPAYWPWMQVIRAFVEEDGAPAGHDEEIARLLPGAGRAQTQDTAKSIVPEQARFRLFNAITTFLKRASRAQPMLIVLDDLHDSDTASLQLLRHMSREIHNAPILVVGTFRDVELGRDHPLTEVMGDLVREHLKARISLGGLTADEVAECIEVTAGVRAPGPVVAAIHRETDGNPFFVRECASLLMDAHAASLAQAAHFGVPPNVRDAVMRRIKGLSEGCREALSAASVIGRQFEGALLRRVAPIPRGALLNALDEAAKRRMIAAQPDEPDTFVFAHGLIRQTLYEHISPSRRAAIHGAIGEAIEARAGGEPRLAELAHHFFEAAPGGDVDKATAHARRAGERAAALLAYEEAAELYGLALQALDLREAADEDQPLAPPRE
jgi:DNA-binding SARP family transcriptional activator